MSSVRGLLFPVCCAAEIPAEVLERFIDANDDDEFNFVFVDSLVGEYDSVSRAPIPMPSSPNSPFIGKTPHQCFELLRQLHVDDGHFAIMDEQSTQESTVLLVARKDGETKSFRARFDDASFVTLNLRDGNADVLEIQQQAAKEFGGVLKVTSQQGVWYRAARA